jgi:hypothetical protein
VLLGRIADAAGTSEIELDLNVAPWGVLVSGHVKRSETLSCISVCLHLQQDATGRIRGASPFSSRGRHPGKSTADILKDLLSGAGLGGDAAQAAGSDPGSEISPSE